MQVQVIVREKNGRFATAEGMVADEICAHLRRESTHGKNPAKALLEAASAGIQTLLAGKPTRSTRTVR